MSTTSVVGLTLGGAGNATRPSAASAASVATSASSFADGRARSYQAKPAASASARIVNEARGQVIALRGTSSQQSGEHVPCPEVQRLRGRHRSGATSGSKCAYIEQKLPAIAA